MNSDMEKSQSQRTTKWHNKPLKYLLSNNPAKVISKSGVKFRKIIRPVLRMILPLLNPYKLIVVKKEPFPRNKSIIYSTSHCFRDDVINSTMAINDHFYILFGSLDQFFNHIEGYLAYINGVVIVDRVDPDSRLVSLSKMERAMGFGTNGLIFPEATWNQDDALLVLKLFGGIYDLAKRTDARIVPVVTLPVGKKCYAIQGPAFDITERNVDKARDIASLMLTSADKITDLSLNEYTLGEYEEEICDIDDYHLQKYRLNINQPIKEILMRLNSLENMKNDVVKSYEIIDYVAVLATRTKNSIKPLMEATSEQEDIKKSIYERISILLGTIINAEKNVSLEILRNRMATYKYDLYVKYANYSGISREELEKKRTLREEWEEICESEIKKVKFYNRPEEKACLFVDKNIISEEEVFSVLDDIKLTSQNVKVLELTRNKNK